MNQNGEHLMNLCELNIVEINTKSCSLCVLHMVVKARTFESTNHIKSKIARHTTVMEDACIREGIWLTNACWVSQSVNQVLNTVSDGVFEENV